MSIDRPPSDLRIIAWPRGFSGETIINPKLDKAKDKLQKLFNVSMLGLVISGDKSGMPLFTLTDISREGVACKGKNIQEVYRDLMNLPAEECAIELFGRKQDVRKGMTAVVFRAMGMQYYSVNNSEGMTILTGEPAVNDNPCVGYFKNGECFVGHDYEPDAPMCFRPALSFDFIDLKERKN